MHPIEHLLYWSDSLIHVVLPSHPALFLYNLHITATGAVVWDIGFDNLKVGELFKPIQILPHRLHGVKLSRDQLSLPFKSAARKTYKAGLSKKQTLLQYCMIFNQSRPHQC
jgi:hypothetical protein